jgi:hypothetical protein
MLKRRLAPFAVAILLLGCDGSAKMAQPGNRKTGQSGTPCYLVVWIKAFIDPSTTDSHYITVVGPPSADEGEWAVVAPWMADLVGPDLFLTDDRGPQAVIDASSRMHSEARFVIQGSEAPLLSDTGHVMGTSVGIERGLNGDATVCKLRASSAGMSWGAPEVSGTAATGRTTALELRGSARDACLVAKNPLTGSIVAEPPPIDYKGKLIVTNYGGETAVRFVGVVDHYPSFEMYARDSHGRTARILYQPNVGRNPSDLAADTTKLIYVNNSVGMCHDQGGGN